MRTTTKANNSGISPMVVENHIYKLVFNQFATIPWLFKEDLKAIKNIFNGDENHYESYFFTKSERRILIINKNGTNAIFTEIHPLEPTKDLVIYIQEAELKSLVDDITDGELEHAMTIAEYRLSQSTFRLNYSITGIPVKRLLDSDIYCHGGAFEEFENEFEEGWGGNKDVPTLANHEHHLTVCSVVANTLYLTGWAYCPKKGNLDPDIMLHIDLAWKMYADVSKILYPEDRIWYGDSEDDELYWDESNHY